MAGTIIAYSEITILDLIDTATYIYYSANENGTGASTAPDANTKYIGIYSGPTLEDGQPSVPPEDTVWSKYVGEDGEPGAPGTSITIKSTSVKYINTAEDVQPSESADWETFIPTIPQGSYLWTWTQVVYSDNSVTNTYSKTYLGKDANAYYIESSQETVLVFLTKKGRETSPEVLQIALYDMPFSGESERVDFTQNYKFGYIDKEKGFVSLISEKECTIGNYITDSFGKFVDGVVYYEYSSETGYVETDDTTLDPEKVYFILEDGSENVLFFKIQDFLNRQTEEGYEFDSNLLLKFAYLQENEEAAIKIIPVRDGVSSEMAQFNVEATKINAAVRDSFLEFDETGLSLRLSSKGGSQNQGLKIYKDEEKIFWADNRGNLHLKGNLEAATGSFEGTIHATEASFDSGEIGGFEIEANSLISKDGGIVLNGSEGTIKASSIELGTGATIKSYIQLGDACLYNPNSTEAGGKVLKCGNIVINQDGTASFGEISVNGTGSKLYGDSWSITPSRAEFSNISVSGSIETAVFNTATTQAVGSAMLFMQSYKIESINKNVITVDRDVEGDISVDTLVWLVNDNLYFSYRVQSVSGANITLNIPTEITVKATAIIIIGKEADKPLIFGANGGNVKVADNLIYPRGITINEYSNTGLPHLFLGDLEVLNDSKNIGYTGYGLYSDNVYLNGSLTTKVGENSYAGVNTLNGASALVFATDYKGKDVPEETDTSKIVFWAGADSISTSAIQNAYFQVTEQGSIYASRAKLTNSLMVGGEIKGSDIYAARIHGWNDEDDSIAALTIYDTTKGISFKTKNENDIDVETFSIGADGLKIRSVDSEGQEKASNFITISDNRVSYNGASLTINEPDSANSLSLSVLTEEISTEEGVSVVKHTPVLKHTQDATSCGFYFETNKTNFQIGSKKKIIWSGGDTKILGIINFSKDETDIGFQYKPTEGEAGYDLFITEPKEEENGNS